MRIADMQVTPIALGDPPLLNAAGLHAPYCLRTIVELRTDDGVTGVAEIPGGGAVTDALPDARDPVLGADPLQWHSPPGRHPGSPAPQPDADRGDQSMDRRPRV